MLVIVVVLTTLVSDKRVLVAVEVKTLLVVLVVDVGW